MVRGCNAKRQHRKKKPLAPIPSNAHPRAIFHGVLVGWYAGGNTVTAEAVRGVNLLCGLARLVSRVIFSSLVPARTSADHRRFLAAIRFPYTAQHTGLRDTTGDEQASIRVPSLAPLALSPRERASLD